MTDSHFAYIGACLYDLVVKILAFRLWKTVLNLNMVVFLIISAWGESHSLRSRVEGFEYRSTDWPKLRKWDLWKYLDDVDVCVQHICSLKPQFVSENIENSVNVSDWSLAKGSDSHATTLGNTQTIAFMKLSKGLGWNYLP